VVLLLLNLLILPLRPILAIFGYSLWVEKELHCSLCGQAVPRSMRAMWWHHHVFHPPVAERMKQQLMEIGRWPIPEE